MPEIKLKQPEDLNGNTDFMTRNPVLITGNGTTEIFTGSGVFLGVVIWVPVDGGTIYFTDSDDASIPGLPTSANKASVTRAGTFPLKNYYLTNGLKVIVASAAGVVITIPVTTDA